MRPLDLLSCDGLRGFCAGRPWCGRLLAVVRSLALPDDVHGFGHVVRVACMAYNIAVAEYGGGVDLDLVVAAALLHDVGRAAERPGLHHAVASAEAAKAILPGVGAPVDPEKAARVILEHSFSLGSRPGSPESCSLSDADKLDALGYIGLYRLAYVSALTGRSMGEAVNHYEEKLRRLPDLMCTRVARNAARELARVLGEAVEWLRRASAEAAWAVEA